MTSASELFHSRRYRFGFRHNAIDVSGFDSSPADANSLFAHHHRTTSRRHHHYSSQHNRRQLRHDLDGCDLPLRRAHRPRLDHLEHEPVHPEQGGSQSSSGSIINSEDFRSIRRERTTGSDRLPGAVLLARERLVERLRGVSVSGNRQNTGSSSSSSHQDDLLEIRGEWLEAIASESRQPVAPNHTPGLAQDALNCLPLQVFSSAEEPDETSTASSECTICLEGFKDGDRLIRLRCMHRFHSCCLFPWVRVCGACPNCRKAVVVTRNDTIL